MMTIVLTATKPTLSTPEIAEVARKLDQYARDLMHDLDPRYDDEEVHVEVERG